MKQKAIIFTAPGKAELLDTEKTHPGYGQVLVRLAVSTISAGTERANLTGDPNVQITAVPADQAVFPRRSGYSSSGIVEEVGEGVKSLVPGDRVAMSWTLHQQYICKEEQDVYKLDEDQSFAEGALWHIGTFPLAAIRKCRLEIGESSVVMGLGILGMMAVKLLRAGGAVPVIAVDPVKEKRELALSIGADAAFDPFSPDFVQQVKELTGHGAAAAIEVTGNGKALDQVLDCMARFGRVALLGCTRNKDFTIDYYHKVHGPGISLIGAHTAARPYRESYPGMWTTRDDVLAIQKLVRMHRLEFASLVKETYTPEEAPDVYRRLAEDSAFPVTQFDWTALW